MNTISYNTCGYGTSSEYIDNGLKTDTAYRIIRRHTCLLGRRRETVKSRYSWFSYAEWRVEHIIYTQWMKIKLRSNSTQQHQQPKYNWILMIAKTSIGIECIVALICRAHTHPLAYSLWYNRTARTLTKETVREHVGWRSVLGGGEGRAGVEYSQVECLRGRIDDTNRVHTLCTHLFEFKFLEEKNILQPQWMELK